MNKINENILPPAVVDIIKNMNMSETSMARDNYYHRLLSIREAIDIAITAYEKSTNKSYRK